MPPFSNKEIKSIKTLIAESKTDTAFEVIEKKIPQNDLIEKEFILIKSRWTKGKESYHTGLIKLEDWQLLNSQTNNSLLIILEKIPNQAEVLKEKIILFLYSNPGGKYPLGFDEEVEQIRTAIEKSERPQEFGLIVEGGVTIDDLEVLIPKYDPFIVHICVNSLRNQGNGLMLFEGSNGTEVELNHEIFTEIMEEIFENDISSECFIFNTCFSQNYANIISHFVPTVIAMQDLTTGALPFEFSRIFYSNLFNGSSIESAFNKTKRGIKLNLELQREWDIPRRPEDVPIIIQGKK